MAESRRPWQECISKIPGHGSFGTRVALRNSGQISPRSSSLIIHTSVSATSKLHDDLAATQESVKQASNHLQQCQQHQRRLKQALSDIKVSNHDVQSALRLTVSQQEQWQKNKHAVDPREIGGDEY
jgi:septal ring factor EnvC (AmiA/AmiB activator)